MFTLMIVDDEPTIRKGLTQFIHWDTLDVELIGEASDGAKALVQIREKRPDIVITDIRMPNMDGLELVRALAEEIPETKVILLTGYADFSYAQEALRYGVVDFVLKPTSKDKISSAIKLAQEKILIERKAESALAGDLAILREQFLEQLTRGFAEASGIEKRIATFDIKLDKYFLAAFQFSECETERRQRNILSLKNMVSVLNNDGYTYFFNGNMVFTLFRTTVELPTPPKAVLESCREIADTVNNFSETRVSVGLSRLKNGVAELPAAGEEAIFALSRQFFTDEEFSVCSSPISKENELQGGGEHLPIDEAAFLCNAEAMLSSYDFDGIKNSIKAYFVHQNSTVANARNTINTCVQLYYICTRVLSRNGRETLDAALQSSVSQGSSMTALKNTVFQIIEETERRLRHGSQKNSPTVSDAVEYIAKHYAESLHLSDIADYVHINPQHLCRVFKKELGETINEYITRIRIDEAKRLLSDERKLAYEVAELVGFKDAAYFSLIFKKITGQSPKNFK